MRGEERGVLDLVELFVQWNEDGVVTEVTERLCETIGRSPESVVGRPVSELLGSVPREPGEVEVKHPDGEACCLAVRPACGPDGAGMATFTDLTAGRALDRLMRRTLRTFEQAPLGMAIVRLDARRGGTLLQVNAAARRLLGLDHEALVGATLRDLTHPEDLAGEVHLIQRLLQQGIDHYRLDKRFSCVDGGYAWVTVNVALVRDVDGTPMHAVMQLEDARKRRRTEADLRRLAEEDPLTGLANRRRLADEIALQLARGRMSGATGAVIVVGLDRFKYVNDTAGTTVGDRLLQQVAETMRAVAPDGALVGRLGSDEFAVVLGGEEGAQARAIAEGLLERLRTGATVRAGQGRIRVTASAGVATFTGAEQVDDVISIADMALAQAKDEGGDRVVAYDQPGSRRARMASRLTWAQRVRHALEHDELTFAAQPIVDLSVGEPVAYELLLRLPDGTGGWVRPDTFLDAAEHFGLMPAIDRWAVREATLMAASLGLQSSRVRVEVNLSPAAVNDEAIVDYIEQAIERHGVDPQAMVFEITERAAIANLPRARELVNRLRSLGCRFALDDFGSGFGSFYNLKHLPFDYLKIDGEFVQRLANDESDQHIVRSIAAAAHGLGKETVAEFVADQTSIDLLLDWGVRYGQGFLLGEPRPAWRTLGGAPREVSA